jgi:methyl-accepting chemotaxis protein
MSTALLVTLTVIEIVALVVVLALFLIAITRRLRSIANALGQMSGGVLGAIQGDVCLIGAGAAILNNQLNTISQALSAIAEKAESLPSQAQIPAQRQTAAAADDWQPAIGPDPMIKPR